MWLWDLRFTAENKARFNVQQRLVNTSYHLDPEGLSYQNNANTEKKTKSHFLFLSKLGILVSLL